MVYCEDQNGTINYSRAVQGHSHGVTINPAERDTVELEGTHFHTGSKNATEWSWGRRIESEKHETSLFFSPLNSQDPSSRQRTIDWTGPDDQPRMVLLIAQITIAFVTSICDELKTQIILYDNVRAHAVDKVVTFAGEVLFERNPRLDQAGGGTKRQT